LDTHKPSEVRLFCDIVRVMREARGLSQQELGARCRSAAKPQGISQSAIQQIEGGTYSIRESTLAQIAAAMGMDLRSFLLEGLKRTAP
jgi:transcriptional regulator with XRE-family HTH domain